MRAATQAPVQPALLSSWRQGSPDNGRCYASAVLATAPSLLAARTCSDDDTTPGRLFSSCVVAQLADDKATYSQVTTREATT